MGKSKQSTPKLKEDELTLEELEMLTNPEEVVSGDTNPDLKEQVDALAGSMQEFEGELIASIEQGEQARAEIDAGAVAAGTDIEFIAPIVGDEEEVVTEPELPSDIVVPEAPEDLVPSLPEEEPEAPVIEPTPTTNYYNYDAMSFLGEVLSRDNEYFKDAPVIKLDGPITHIRMKQKLNEFIDHFHPETQLRITPDRIRNGSIILLDLLHMAFNAPARSEQNNRDANLVNCFQLLLEVMAHPMLRPCFNPRYIYAYNDRAFKYYPELIGYMLRMTDTGTTPMEWRENSIPLSVAFSMTRKRWNRSHLPKFDAFVEAWTMSR